MDAQSSVTRRRPFLDYLSAPAREQLYGQARRRPFGADELLSLQGDDADGALVVDSGIVKVTVSSANGSEVLLGLFGRGHLLGEMSTLQSTPRSATVVGHVPGVVLQISKQAFRSLLDAQPDLIGFVLAGANQRLLEADRHRLAYAAKDVSQRVALTLISWAREYGRADAHGIQIGLRASRRELAQIVVASEKSVDAALTSLSRAGLVRTGRRRFVVCDLAGLESWSEAQQPP